MEVQVHRTAQSVTAGSGPSNSVDVSASTNRITTSGYGYDSNGNMTNDGANTLVYDAENRVASINSGATTYSYDAASLRVKKVTGSTTTVYVFSGTKVIAEYVNGSLNKEYIYSGGTLIATHDSGTLKYHHADHLSMRLTTDTNGSVTATSGHYPFGESWYETGGANKLKFTSYERDSESGNDYAMMRYHVPRLGRFSSPDLLAGSISDPQSLNRFAYVRNNPINLVDPLGLEWYCWEVEAAPQQCWWVGSSVTGGGGDLFALWNHGGPEGDPEQGGGGGGQINPRETPPPPPGYEDCIMAALREVIANAEGTNGPNGYGLLVYGTVLPDRRTPATFSNLAGMRFTPASPFVIANPGNLTGHPGIFVDTGSGPSQPSSAFGRYQITWTTAQRFGFTNFSPAGQDAAANTIMQRVGMVNPAMAGNLGQAMRNGNSTWTSLPGGSQQRMNIPTATSIFRNAMSTLPECQ